MKTPVTKPLKKGAGAVVRFMNDEMEALVAELAGSGNEIAARMRDRLEAALRRNQEERETYAAHQRVAQDLSADRLAMRGWRLASAPDDRIELHLRHGDFLRDGDGWQYGVPGAFDGEAAALHDKWQACLFSRRARRWLYVTERPTSHETALAEGTAALKGRRSGFRREDDGNEVDLRHCGTTDRLDILHYYRQDLRHHGKVRETVGTRYGRDVRLMSGRAVVKTVVGFFETLENHRNHPTYDIWAMAQPSKHTQKERTGPFWCASPPAWTISVDGSSDQSVLNNRPAYEATPRDRAIFEIFASRDEAVAYAATLVDSGWGASPRPLFDMTVETPAVTPAALETPGDEFRAGDVFARAA